MASLLVAPDTPIGLTVGNPNNTSLNANLIPKLLDLGARWLRHQPYWSAIETSKGVYSWSGLDSVVSACNSNGINLLVTVSRPPTWQLLSNGAPDPNGTKAMATAICQRYDGKHGFGQIQGIELGNEDYDGGTPIAPLGDASDLAITMNLCYPGLKSAYPNLIVGPGASLKRNTSNYTNFWTTMWAKAAGHFDYMNIHYYTCNNNQYDPSQDSTNTPSFPHAMHILQTAATNAGHANFPLWVTETGFPINSNGGYPPACIDSQQTQSNYVQYELDQLKGLNQPAKMFIYTLTFGNTTPTTGQGTSQGESLYQGVPGSGGFATVAYGMVKNYSKSWGGGSSIGTNTRDVNMRSRLRVGISTNTRDVQMRSGVKVSGATVARDISMRSSLVSAVYDTFVRTRYVARPIQSTLILPKNQPQWGNSTSGDNWVQANGTATPTVASNEGQITGATGNVTMRLGTETMADVEASVRFSVSQIGDIAGITVRDQGLNTFYRLRVNASQLQLVQQTPTGGFVVLASYAFTVAAATFYWLKFRVQGTGLWGKIWQSNVGEPTWLLSTTSSGVTGAGQVGLAAALATATDTVRFDHFLATTASSTTAPPLHQTRDIVMRSGLFTRPTTLSQDIAMRSRLVDASQITVTTYPAKRPPLQRIFPKS